MVNTDRKQDRLFGMNARAILFSALAFCLVFTPFIAAASVSLPPVPGHAPKLTIYLAKGEANSCGQGCDRWIAVEGTVDAGAALRVRQFLRGVKDIRRPIYFHSPGGEARQALAIGRLLRARKAIGRVGRTIVSACAAGSQVDDACLKVKTAGGEVQADLATRGAMCNSACGYLFLGATTREVAPDAALGVHSGKLIVEFRGHPTARQRAEVMASHRNRADREIASFVEAMGISHELFDLARTVKFEDVHFLTRQELYRFRIDTRSFAETEWTLQIGPPASIRKIAVAKKEDGGFRTTEWRLSCQDKDHARLMFLREFENGAVGRSSVALVAGSETPPNFVWSAAKVGIYETWNAVIASDAVKSLFALPRLQVGERAVMPDGKTTEALFEIETRGFEAAWKQLSPTCATSLGEFLNKGSTGIPYLQPFPVILDHSVIQDHREAP
jgi:hypothetical protein